MQTQSSSNQFEGQCRYCQQTISKRQSLSHGDKCPSKPLTDIPGFRLRITSQIWKNFRLIIEASESATFQSLDTLLRKLRLECCDHFSQFGDWGGKEFGKSGKILHAFQGTGTKKITYIYDFRSETRLDIEFVKMIDNVPAGKVNCLLVARNHFPDLYCRCNTGEVKYFCRACISQYQGKSSFYCTQCALTHPDKGNHDLMEVSNSPRMGVCYYEQEYPLDVLFP